MNKASYEFHFYPDDDKAISLEFVVNEDEIDIYHFHDLCKRFAAALGYHPNSIKRTFGETDDSVFE